LFINGLRLSKRGRGADMGHLSGLMVGLPVQELLSRGIT
jgi:hypothetical protein